MFDDIKSILGKSEKQDSAPHNAGDPASASVTSSSEKRDTRVISITNQKGGCGKTTTAINLSAGLAKRGFKVLLADLDAQAHASLGIGIDTDALETSIYDVFVKNADMERVIFHTYVENLDIAPAASLLSGAQLEIADLLGREGILRTALYKMMDNGVRVYDYVVFDNSPSLNLLTINGLTAASHVLVPIQTHYFSLEGMRELLSTIRIVKERLNHQLELLGILPTLYDLRTRMNRDILAQIKDYFHQKVFQTTIRVNIKLAEAAANRKAIFDYAPESNGAQDYNALTDEVIALTRNQEVGIGDGARGEEIRAGTA